MNQGLLSNNFTLIIIKSFLKALKRKKNLFCLRLWGLIKQLLNFFFVKDNFFTQIIVHQLILDSNPLFHIFSDF
jgi:hypothetical protein